MATNLTHGIYRHATSGDLFAASVSEEDGETIDLGLAGPLYYQDPILPSDEYEYEPESLGFFASLVFVCETDEAAAAGKTAQDLRTA